MVPPPGTYDLVGECLQSVMGLGNKKHNLPLSEGWRRPHAPREGGRWYAARQGIRSTKTQTLHSVLASRNPHTWGWVKHQEMVRDVVCKVDRDQLYLCKALIFHSFLKYKMKWDVILPFCPKDYINVGYMGNVFGVYGKMFFASKENHDLLKTTVRAAHSPLSCLHCLSHRYVCCWSIKWATPMFQMLCSDSGSRTHFHLPRL